MLGLSMLLEALIIAFVAVTTHGVEEVDVHISDKALEFFNTTSFNNELLRLIAPTNGTRTNSLRVGIPSLFSLIQSLPLPVFQSTSGTCTAGTTYAITSIQTLSQHLADLECIFDAAQTPTTVGLGYYFGSLLLALNSVWPAFVSPVAYQGDYVVETRLKGRQVYLGSMYLAGFSPATAEWKIGDLPGQLAEGEYLDTAKQSLVMDFRQPVEELETVTNATLPYSIRGFFPFRNSIPPINAFVDVCRVAGRDAKDNGTIMLCKAMISDDTKGFATVMYYGLKNFDPTVNPEMATGNLITVQQSFTYSRDGLQSILHRLTTVLDNTQTYALTELRNHLRGSVLNTLFPLELLTSV